MLCSNQLSYVAKWRALFAQIGYVSSLSLKKFIHTINRLASRPFNRSSSLHLGDSFTPHAECFCPTFAHAACTVIDTVPGLMASCYRSGSCLCLPQRCRYRGRRQQISISPNEPLVQKMDG